MLKWLWRPCQSLISVHQRRQLLTIAIETSCDDTSVAVLETSDKKNASPAAKLHFHDKITADNAQYRGIHPIVAIESHNTQLALLVARAIEALPSSISAHSDAGYRCGKKRPDFVSVTRGPGLLSCLSVGLNTAKGLAVAWQVPLVAINHMQAHALTPRLVSALETCSQSREREPQFPFLTLLVSGGHTMLVHSKTLTSHAILASTTDIAVGDFIDKAARLILPHEVVQSSADIMYGRLLERFAFPDGADAHEYTAPDTRAEEMSRKPSKWGWALAAPLSGSKSKAMEFSFSGAGSAVKRCCQGREEVMTLDERVNLAQEALRVAFEHLASRAIMALEKLNKLSIANAEKIHSLVVSGGVASNHFLRKVYVNVEPIVSKHSFANTKSEGSARTSIFGASPTSS
ncbi:MAG: hypothetical protein Q9202_001249 [Teloschistes flavicans]